MLQIERPAPTPTEPDPTSVILSTAAPNFAECLCQTLAGVFVPLFEVPSVADLPEPTIMTHTLLPEPHASDSHSSSKERPGHPSGESTLRIWYDSTSVCWLCSYPCRRGAGRDSLSK